jgi:heme-degrading monooxygenase HmoA
MATYRLAQCNIARLRAPLDSPVLEDFVAALEPTNRLADRAPGFVWRLQTEDGDATAIRVFDDDMLIVNMSVWESIDALAQFVYRSGHRDVMRRRRQWFEKPDDAYLVLWWIPAETLPAVSDAQFRFERLRSDGPASEAFTFRSQFPPPDASIRSNPVADDWFCPT